MNTSIIRSVLDDYLAEELANDIMQDIKNRTMRRCAGYTIIQAISLDAAHEIVIGYNPFAVAQYVCWDCTNGDDYNTGSYCQTYRQALLVLSERLHDRYDWLPLEYRR